MKRLFLIFCLMLVTTRVVAHELTPTYPEFKPSHMQGIYKTQVSMFNKRKDVEFYELGVFDADFGVVDFVTAYRVFPLPFLAHITLDIYVRDVDVKRVTYICTRSKLRAETYSTAVIASRVCSKVK